MQVVLGFPEPRAESSLPRLRLVLTGITRSCISAPERHQAKPRLPITLGVLQRVFNVLATQQISDRLVTLLWAICSVCFSFFKLGELLVPSANSSSSSKHLAWGDVSVDSINNPSQLRIHLSISKCNQFSKGVDIFIGRSQNHLCPITACLAYMAVHVWGPTPGPFFCTSDGLPFTKPQFVSKVHKLLTEAGLPTSLHLGHSFRIGATTSAARAGIKDSVIKALGLWSSTTFLFYIRTSRQQLAQLTSTIASS